MSAATAVIVAMLCSIVVVVALAAATSGSSTPIPQAPVLEGAGTRAAPLTRATHDYGRALPVAEIRDGRVWNATGTDEFVIPGVGIYSVRSSPSWRIEGPDFAWYGVNGDVIVLLGDRGWLVRAGAP